MTVHAAPPAVPNAVVPNDLEAFWLPFTPNRSFKKNPRMIARAKDMHYYTPEGVAVLDGAAGLWCCNAGHNRAPIVKAIQDQAADLDFSPTFQFGHPKAFQLASRLAALAPGDLDHVFFCNSGSEAVETALKIALAYQRARGQGSRTRLIGRERGYHGVNFGGISVGGMVNNRKFYGSLLTGVDHLPSTYSREHQAFTKGEPEWGGHLADELERIVALHDASTIAAVIVEPMAGSTGVLPPPKGYLKRLREITSKHGILLIFDEVVTGFGRLGAPFAAQALGVTPDLITCAKGMSNGAVPMGGVLVHRHVHDAMSQGSEATVEFAHGYTYSGHPLACAAALATLDVYQEEGIFEKVARIAGKWEAAIHDIGSAGGVVRDIRNLGLLGAVEIEAAPNAPGQRARAVANHCFENGIFVRAVGDTLILSPPLIINEEQIGQIADGIKNGIRAL